jgi:acyl-CoA synthetase (AMP-forming)/AMP-acid ligase II
MNTLGKLLSHRAFVTPQNVALEVGENKYSYLELEKRSNKIAGKLSAEFSKGDRIAILSANEIDVPVLIVGCLKSGVVPVQINWWIQPNELKLLIPHAEIKAIYYSESFLPIVENGATDIPLMEIGELLNGVKDLPEFFSETIGTDDEAIQIFTSGTTGTPKGIVLTHKNLLAMIRNITLDFPGMGYGQRSLIAVPLFNIAGAGYLFLTLGNGGTVVMQRQFDAVSFVEMISSKKITNIFLPPALIMAIVNAIPDNHPSFEHLKLLHYGGAPIPAALLKAAHHKFGCDLVQGYGLTETSGIISLLRASDHQRILSSGANDVTIVSAGKQVAGVELKIVNNEGAEVQRGEIGELLVRGESIITSYWGNAYPEGFADGWLKTGDFVKQDNDGFLYILDRKNDMIISKGINVYPSEVEAVLNDHPKVDQVCVLGIESEEYGEMICAAIIKNSNDLTESELDTWSRKHLSGYKIPRKWVFVDELPKNLAGKVVRKQLKINLK